MRPAGWMHIGRVAKLARVITTTKGAVFGEGTHVFVTRYWKGRFTVQDADERRVSGLSAYDLWFVDGEHTAAGFDEKYKQDGWPYNVLKEPQ